MSKALPGETEVVELVEQLNRWRSETVNQWSDEYEPRTSWERQVSDAMKGWYEASTQVADALQAMQARVKELEEALEPFAAYIEARDENDSDFPDDARVVAYARNLREAAAEVTVGDFRRARATLAAKGGQ